MFFAVYPAHGNAGQLCSTGVKIQMKERILLLLDPIFDQIHLYR